MSFRLPTFATAPFCPSEVHGSISISDDIPFWKKLATFAGPGLLISVGYMDPGNWATDIEAGSKFGYNLLFVVLLSSAFAIVLQCLSSRLGLIAGKDLAQLCKERYGKKTNFVLWILAELAIIATDVAEVLGGALALKLLFGVSLTTGIFITALDTFLVLGFKGKGFRQIEAIVLGLISTIGICYFVELWLIGPHWPDVFSGFVPKVSEFNSLEPWYVAIGILGATVMPHNLYLHSSIVQTRKLGTSRESKKLALRLSFFDTTISLSLAFFVNAAILILAASAFNATGHHMVTEIDDAYHLLDPVVGGKIAGLLFGIALLASGQSSTFTGTIAGQVLLEGFTDFKIPCWQRRLITRALALLPALFGVWLLGEGSTGRMLVLSQVVLSLQLPFAIFPLIRMTSDAKLMGEFAIGKWNRLAAWSIFAIIAAANMWLLVQLLTTH